MTLSPLILLAGQSNAGGSWTTGSFAGGVIGPHATVDEWSCVSFDEDADTFRQSWSSAGIRQAHTIGQLGDYLGGVELQAGPDLVTAGYTPAVIKVSKGGTDLAQDWAPNGVAGVQLWRTWVDEIVRAVRAVDHDDHPYLVPYVVWIQGEADGIDAAKAAAYQANLTALISATRTELSAPGLVWIIARCANTQTLVTHRATIQAAQDAVDAGDSNVDLINCDDLAVKVDNVHYTEASLVTLGSRVATRIAARLAALTVPELTQLRARSSVYVGDAITESRVYVVEPEDVPYDFGQAASFNGTTSYAEVPDSSGLSPTAALSLVWWQKHDAAIIERCPLAKWEAAQSSWFVESFSSSSILIFVADSLVDAGSNYGFTPASSVVVDAWQHIAIVYDGSLSGNANRLKIWINGVAQTLTFGGTIPATLTDSTAKLAIGRRNMNGGDRYWNGDLDEVGVYNVALTPAEVAADFARLRTTRGLVSWYRFEDDVVDAWNGNEPTTETAITYVVHA